MIAPAPHIPNNLRQKLIAAVQPFQRGYDTLTLAEARRLLARHDFKVPVLCSLVFHGNGNLKHVAMRENLKRRAASPGQFASEVTVFTSPEQGAEDLRSECLRWIAENAAMQFIAEQRHRAFQMADEEIDALLRRIPEYPHYRSVNFGDVSLLVFRRIVEKERDLRRGESKHARLLRYSQAAPSDLLAELEEERQAALTEWDDAITNGYSPHISFDYRSWPKEEGIVLTHRERSCRDAYR